VIGVPVLGRYFWSGNSGLQNQDVHYTGLSLDGPGTVWLDPNTLSTDGTVALGDYQITKDGSMVAYQLSRCELQPPRAAGEGLSGAGFHKP
jgi:Prolyl oligopeptidase, N-terminal beta-propeller domain